MADQEATNTSSSTLRETNSDPAPRGSEALGPPSSPPAPGSGSNSSPSSSESERSADPSTSQPEGTHEASQELGSSPARQPSSSNSGLGSSSGSRAEGETYPPDAIVPSTPPNLGPGPTPEPELQYGPTSPTFSPTPLRRVNGSDVANREYWTSLYESPPGQEPEDTQASSSNGQGRDQSQENRSEDEEEGNSQLLENTDNGLQPREAEPSQSSEPEEQPRQGEDTEPPSNQRQGEGRDQAEQFPNPHLNPNYPFDVNDPSDFVTGLGPQSTEEALSTESQGSGCGLDEGQGQQQQFPNPQLNPNYPFGVDEPSDFAAEADPQSDQSTEEVASQGPEREQVDNVVVEEEQEQAQSHLKGAEVPIQSVEGDVHTSPDLELIHQAPLPPRHGTPPSIALSQEPDDLLTPPPMPSSSEVAALLRTPPMLPSSEADELLTPPPIPPSSEVRALLGPSPVPPSSEPPELLTSPPLPPSSEVAALLGPPRITPLSVPSEAVPSSSPPTVPPPESGSGSGTRASPEPEPDQGQEEKGNEEKEDDEKQPQQGTKRKSPSSTSSQSSPPPKRQQTSRSKRKGTSSGAPRKSAKRKTPEARAGPSKKQKPASPKANTTLDDGDEKEAEDNSQDQNKNKGKGKGKGNGKKGKARPRLNEPPTMQLDVYGFGVNCYGQLGLGHAHDHVKEPTLNQHLSKKSVGVVQLAAGGAHCAALTHNNKILTWGLNDDGQLGRQTRGLGDDELDRAKGSPNKREMRPGEVDFSGASLPPDTVFTQVVATASATFVLTEFGDVYGWGTFRDNQKKLRRKVEQSRREAEGKGGNGSGNEGNNEGDNESDQKGDSDGEDVGDVIGFPSAKDLRQCTPVKIEGLRNITCLAAGAEHVLARSYLGAVYAWGGATKDQLGREKLARRGCNDPHLIPRVCKFPNNGRRNGAFNIDKIGAGAYHSFAIQRGGGVYSWGWNMYGQTGAPQAGDDNYLTSDATVPLPTLVSDLQKENTSSVTGGIHHSIAVTEDKRCLSWGRIRGNALGIPDEDMKSDSVLYSNDGAWPKILKTPTLVTRIPGRVASAVAGMNHSLAAVEKGRLFGWGSNIHYEIGLGHKEDVQSATLIDRGGLKDKKVVSAAAGSEFTVLLVE